MVYVDHMSIENWCEKYHFDINKTHKCQFCGKENPPKRGFLMTDYHGIEYTCDCKESREKPNCAPVCLSPRTEEMKNFWNRIM